MQFCRKIYKEPSIYHVHIRRGVRNVWFKYSSIKKDSKRLAKWVILINFLILRILWMVPNCNGETTRHIVSLTRHSARLLMYKDHPVQDLKKNRNFSPTQSCPSTPAYLKHTVRNQTKFYICIPELVQIKYGASFKKCSTKSEREGIHRSLLAFHQR